MMSNKQRIIAIVGPTASGKTSLSIALAKELNGEIISADSMQIYKDISIGTARPSVEEMMGIPHHLMGFLALSEPYSVAQYVKDARNCILSIAEKNKLPILCGGTGLYVQSVIDNIQFSETESDLTIRETLKKKVKEEGSDELLNELKQIDPETANRLHPNDAGRIIRALEVYYSTGKTMTQHRMESKTIPSPYDATIILLDYKDRNILYDRINLRVDLMIKNGLIEEAESFLNSEYAPTAMQAIGYKELKPYFDQEISLDEAIDNIKQSTRHYAKRQLSWFRHMDNIHTLYMDNKEMNTVQNEALDIILNR